MFWRCTPAARAFSCLAGPLVAASMVFAAPAGTIGTPSVPAGGGLPDLDQAVPSQLLVLRAGGGKRPTYQLGFQSATANVGDGPLIIDGHRTDIATPTMVADQLVDRGQEPPQVVQGVGGLKYARSPDHQHWHLLGFMRYDLRRAGSFRVQVRAHKSGFCLGDRYRVMSRDVPASSEGKVYTTRCGLNLPGRLNVREGISVGYGDNYTAFLEGQSLSLSGLRAGRYVLVHRVNVERRFRELSYENNAASVLLDLRWRHRVPALRVLASCPDTDRCDLPAGTPGGPTAAH